MGDTLAVEDFESENHLWDLNRYELALEYHESKISKSDVKYSITLTFDTKESMEAIQKALDILGNQKNK